MSNVTFNVTCACAYAHAKHEWCYVCKTMIEALSSISALAPLTLHHTPRPGRHNVQQLVEITESTIIYNVE